MVLALSVGEHRCSLEASKKQVAVPAHDHVRAYRQRDLTELVDSADGAAVLRARTGRRA